MAMRSLALELWCLALLLYLGHLLLDNLLSPPLNLFEQQCRLLSIPIQSEETVHVGAIAPTVTTKAKRRYRDHL
jgi:hypothetical protein